MKFPDAQSTDPLGTQWPIGSVFFSAVPTNPYVLLGFGTWVAFGAGRAIVGVDLTDTDFDAAEKTSGTKTVAAAGSNGAPAFTGTQASLTHAGAAVADHASHTHTYTDVPNHVHVQSVNSAATGGLSGYTADTSTNTSVASGYSTQTNTGGVASGTTNGPGVALSHSVTQPNAHTYTPAGTVAAPTFTGSQTSVVQPSICLYIWKRSA